MPKTVRRGRRGTNALSRISPQAVAGRRIESLTQRDPRDRPLLERILETAHLAQAVPRLPPEVLHGIINACGLEDCSELVALATPDQLSRVFDLDLWRARTAGRDEELDADRFGVWLAVLMESGEAVAAQKLVDMDEALVIAALARHVRVFDRAAVCSGSDDGEEVLESRPGHAVSCEVGHYLIEARRADAWDTIVDLLRFLDAEHPDYFHRVMHGCLRLSNSRPEADGFHDLLDDREQNLFDLEVDRETRRETQGYVTPSQARAFLEMARRLDLRHEAPPPENPVARAYFRGIERTQSRDEDAPSGSRCLPAASGSPLASTGGRDALARLVEVLVDAGVLAPQPRALLEGPQGQTQRLARIHEQLESAGDFDHAVHSMRTEALAYLANTLVAGCSVQGRPFTVREASDAALAVCNLGLENWPRHWPQENRDLVSVFQVGWTVLHDDVCTYAAERLLSVVAGMNCDDLDTQSGLHALRLDLAKHLQTGAPWRARDALDVIAILDMPAWASLLGLIDECPVMHAAIGASRAGAGAIDASAFEFISENSQIASIREFMQSLPETLRG